MRYSISLAAVITGALVGARAQSPVPGSFFAMSAVEEDYPRVNFGTLAHQGFAWPGIEPSRGTFNFRAFDNYMAAAQARGLVNPATNTANFAMTFAAGTPSWAVADKSTCSQPSGGVCTAPPDNIQDWKDFVTVVIQHYNGKTQPHIRYYELWNEFNISLWWTGTDAQLVALAQAAYPIVHQDPYSVLLTPSVAGPVGTVSPNSGVIWMSRYLSAGGSKHADGGAFHGYIGGQGGIVPFPMPEEDITAGCGGSVGCYGSIISKATQMRAVFDQNGLSGKPMYQTEGSWGNETVTDPETQIDWIARYNLLQAGLRESLNLQMAAWFTWGGGTTFGWGDIETASLEPTAAGMAYSQVYNWITGASLNQPCAGGSDGTWTCTLTRAGGYTAQAVWNTKGPAVFKTAAGYTQYRDLAGGITPILPGAGVPTGPKPVLIESPPPAGQPLILLAANAAGELPLIAPNTWLEIKGFNLAPAGDNRIWQNADFAASSMPMQLDGVNVTVNGKNAFVYYISPAQVNVLTPPDAMDGPVQIQLTNAGAASPVVSVPARPVSPSFFEFGAGPYIAAEHADGRYLGPPSLYPDATTPAQPGETIVLFANGFGATSASVVSGSPTQGGALNTLPAIRIGGVTAAVKFAGLIGPGEFQFNVVVPASLADGDQPVIATYGGISTQAGALISVQR